MLGRLHVVLDVHPRQPDPLPLLAAVLDGGAPVVQLRAKGLAPELHRDLAATVLRRCQDHGATAIVNDSPAIAAAVGAHGCHVGDLDPPVAEVRRLLGPEVVVGATARTPEAARAAHAAGATYVGVGPVHPTTTKTGLPDPIGPEGIALVAAATPLAVIAIGGITVERVPAVLAAGAHGVAVVGAIAQAPDPRSATEAFLDVLGGVAP